MDTDKYAELTGLTVAAADTTRYTAMIRRTKAKLEMLLGYSLNPKDIYTELGKTDTECACPDVDITTLEEADDVEGVYKLFKYNELDKFLHVDPYKTLYKVKLVYIHSEQDFVTVKTLDEAKAHLTRQGIGKYIERCESCFCTCECDGCVQLAVDADWLDCYPDDLLYLWIDMIDYQLDCTKDLKSQSVNGESWTKDKVTAPEDLPDNIQLLKQYAGPAGTVLFMPT